MFALINHHEMSPDLNSIHIIESAKKKVHENKFVCMEHGAWSTQRKKHGIWKISKSSIANEFSSNNIMKLCIFGTHLKWETGKKRRKMKMVIQVK